VAFGWPHLTDPATVSQTNDTNDSSVNDSSGPNVPGLSAASPLGGRADNSRMVG